MGAIDMGNQDQAVTSVEAVGDGALQSLQREHRGEVVRPGDLSYESVRRVWNGSIDRRPAAVARCTGVADVLAAVRCARTWGLPVAVRGGGHSFPGLSVADGALVIDLGALKGIRVDPTGRTARVQAGVLLGELDRETQTFGLAAPMGAVTHTGVAGLTLGGGIGWLMRRLGLAVDQLRAVDLVTADGAFITVSMEQNADLFWGIRGGGGNFGIVTEFEFELHPVGPLVLAGPLLWPLEMGRHVVDVYRDWSADAPDELTTALIARRAPALPFVPRRLHGQPVIGVVCCYAGPLEQGEQVIRPLRELGPPVVDLCEPKPYLTHQAMFDASFPHGLWVYMRAHDVSALSDEIIDLTLDHAGRITSDRSTVTIWQLGGAVARVGDDETAFHGRGSAYTYNIFGATDAADGFDAECGWVRSFSDALAPHQSGVYVNFLMDEGLDRVRQSYGVAKFDRLRALKRAYDPDNAFRLNQNIPPA
jgi:hypothetical protein